MKVLLFSSYRDAAGQRELELTLPTGATVRDAAARLEADYPDLKLKGALAARNEVYAGPDEALEAGDTLAFFPPVAGGSGEPEDWFFVTDKALDVNACLAHVSDAKYGAVSSFLGPVRSPNHGQPVLHIDYEGYEAMIVSQMKRAAAELQERFELGRLVFGHRLGRLAPGEASIVIAISSAHRKGTLLATHAAIDRLKELLPVWKLEATPDGAQWVAGSSVAAETL